MADTTQPPQSGRFCAQCALNAAPIGNGSAIGPTIRRPLPDSAPDQRYHRRNHADLYLHSRSTGSEHLRRLLGRDLPADPLTVAGTKSIVYDSGALTFADQTATDLIMYSRGQRDLWPAACARSGDSDVGAGQQRIADNRRQSAADQVGAAGGVPVRQRQSTAQRHRRWYPTSGHATRRPTTSSRRARRPADVRGHSAPARPFASLTEHLPWGRRTRPSMMTNLPAPRPPIALGDDGMPPRSQFRRQCATSMRVAGFGSAGRSRQRRRGGPGGPHQRSVSRSIARSPRNTYDGDLWQEPHDGRHCPDLRRASGFNAGQTYSVYAGACRHAGRAHHRGLPP